MVEFPKDAHGNVCECTKPPPRIGAPELQQAWLDYIWQREMWCDSSYEAQVEVCLRCGSIWLRVDHYDQSTHEFDRWWRGIVAPQVADRVKLETALDTITALPWHMFGGRWFGHEDGRWTDAALIRPSVADAPDA